MGLCTGELATLLDVVPMRRRLTFALPRRCCSNLKSRHLQVSAETSRDRLSATLNSTNVPSLPCEAVDDCFGWW